MRRLLTIIGLLAQSLGAQSIAARHFGETDGVPHQEVVAVVQTADGCIWASTSNGLACFDSASWQTVDPGLPYAPLMNAAYRPLLATDEAGDLWAFARHAPLGSTRRIDGQWRPLPEQPEADGPISAAAASNLGGEPHALLAGRRRLFRLDGDRWTPLSHAFGRVHALVRHRDTYVAACAGGAFRLSIADPADTPDAIPGLPAGEVLTCAVDPRDDSLWFMGRDWLVHVGDTVQRHEVAMRSNTPLESVKPALLPDGLGGVFYGTQLGLWRYTPGVGEVALTIRPSVGTMALLRDREGFIWAGGTRGLVQFTGNAAINYDRGDGLAATEVASILQLRDGRIVLGHDAQLTILDDPIRTVPLFDRSIYTRVMAMAEGDDGRILAACNRRGLFAIDPDTGDIEQVAAGDRDEDSHRDAIPAQYVAVDEHGNVLVASLHGAAWLQNGKLVPVEIPRDDPMSYIREAIPDGDGVLLSLNREGLMRVSETGMRTWRGRSAAHNDVVCASRRPDGALWVGSRAGALRADDDGTLRHLDLGGHTITRPVYAMVDDHGARTWFATDDGVYAWDGEQLIHKSQHDGLAGRETNRGALLCDTEGRIWVGFARGLSVIDPEHEFATTHAPTVAFLTPLVNGQPAPGESHGSHTVQTATFRFRAISMRDQARLRIQHRLEGLTEQWSQPRALPERAVRFASLPPGRYRLHVRATDSRGQIGEAVSPWLLVPAPWWRSPWFHTLVATATILVLVGAMRLFSQRRYARHLERDVLDRTRALTAERSRLQTTLANIADGIALLDPRGVIVLWTPAAARLTGWSDERVRGRRLTDIVPAFVNDGNDHTRDVEVGVHDGRRRWFEYNTAMLANGAGSVVAFRDVTEKRLQDRLLSRSDRLESLGVLAGGLAHDFNNLLTVMLGNLDLIESERGAGNAGAPNEPFANIRDAIVQARGLTQQLLTFSKGGAPVRELQALAPVVSDSARLALSGSNVDCHVLADDDLRDVEIDRGQIAQVVHNLVLNGMQAMPDGGSITIELHNRDHLPTGVDGSFVAIEVRDRGIGIAAAELDRIFDPYYSTKPGGSGLGLATAHSIVTRHGGSLFVESTPGTGTTFSVYLPAAATRAPAHSDDVADDNGHDLAPCRILCMDDNEGVRTVLRRALAGMGHTVTLTASGEHAIEAFHAARAAGRPFDLVLLDLTVPGGMGGIATLEALRTTDPETTAIATTGYSTEPVLAEFERHGFHATLRKPFTVADVQHALCRAMSARRHDPS